MVKLSYADFVVAMENDQTIEVIGKIDKEIISSQKVESLYYIFPLIERIVLEIYKLIPDADVEHYEQGIMKTLLSIINSNNNIDIIPKNIIDILNKYYCDDGLRNKVLHAQNDIIDITVSFEELNFVLMQLLSILKKLLCEYSGDDFEDVELL